MAGEGTRDPAAPPARRPCPGRHRGIDIAAPFGTSVRAAAGGSVAFAGPVGGRLFVTIHHGAGLESTYSFLASLWSTWCLVSQGQTDRAVGPGHAGALVPHLHFGVRLLDVYVDPLGYSGPVEVWRYIRLAPLDGCVSSGGR